MNVSVMVEPGANPHSYEPKPRQMAALAEAKAYFAIGVPFEAIWLEKIASVNPEMIIIHTDRDIKKIPMATLHHDEDEDNHGHNEGRNLDPHVWTSPACVKIMAHAILQGLLEIEPENEMAYMANYRRFLKDIEAIDTQFRDIFRARKGMEFMVFHPAWGYFAKEFGIKQVPVEIEGKEPKPAQLHNLIKHAKERGIKVIFVQPQISTKSADIIARAINGRVVIADPLAENWMDNLRQQAASFKEALR